MISIENVMLPNKPLSNFELKDAARRLEILSFRGVFLLDTLPKKSNKKECVIVNFDKSGGPGTHWVKTVKLKYTSTVTACNLRSKLSSTWEVRYVITPINFNRWGKYFAVICAYTFSKNSA